MPRSERSEALDYAGTKIPTLIVPNRKEKKAKLIQKYGENSTQNFRIFHEVQAVCKRAQVLV